MIYQKSNFDQLFKENRLCMFSETPSTTETATDTTEQLTAHIDSLNEGRRNHQVRAAATRRFLIRQNSEYSDAEKLTDGLITMTNGLPGFQIGSNFDSSNDTQLVTAVARLQKNLGFALTDDARNTDGIFGSNTAAILNARLAPVIAEVETVTAETTASVGSLADTARADIATSVSSTPVPSPAEVTALDAVTTHHTNQLAQTENEIIESVYQNELTEMSNPINQVAETPTWFRTVASDQDNFRQVLVQQEISNFDAISTHMNSIGISTNDLRLLFNRFQNTGYLEDREGVPNVSADTLLANSNFGRMQGRDLEQNLATARTALNQARAERQQTRRSNRESDAPQEERSAARENLRQAEEEHERATEALKNHNYTFEQFLTDLNQLNSDDSRTPQQESQRNFMFGTLRAIRGLLTEIPLMQRSAPRNLSNDYVNDVSFNLRHPILLNTNGTPLRLNENNKNDRLCMLALMVQVYGDLNTLRAQNLITVNNGQISIVDIGPEYTLLTQLMFDYPNLFTRNRATGNLTEAIFDIQNKDFYPELISAINTPHQNRINTLILDPENPELNSIQIQRDNLAVRSIIDQVFDSRLTGPTIRGGSVFNRHYRSAEIYDTETDISSNYLEEDLVNREFADNQLTRYLLTQISSYEGNTVRYNPEELNTELTSLIEIGKAAVLMHPELEMSLAQFDSSNFSIFEADRITPRRLTSDEITLIRIGLTSKIELDNIAQEQQINELASTPENAYILEFLQNIPNIPEQEIPTLSRQLFTLLAGFRIDDEAKLNDFKLGLAHDFVIYQNPSGEHSVRFQMGTTTDDFTELATNGFTPVAALRYLYNPEGGVGGSVGLRVGPASGSIDSGISFNFGNEYQLSAGVSGGLLAGLPFVGAGVSFGQGFDARINNAVERSAENRLNTLTPEQIISIANGTMSNEEILEIANGESNITTLFENLPPEFPTLSPENTDRFKIYFVKTLCQNLRNHGAETSRGIGWDVGLSVVVIITPAGPIPVIIPRVGMEFAVGRTITYSSDLAYSQVEANQQELLRAQLFAHFAASSNTETQSHTITSESGIISYDAETGQREVFALAGNGSLSQTIVNSQQTALESLNSTTQQVGLNFRLPTPEEQNASRNTVPVNFVFNINDLNDTSGLRLNSNRNFNIYADPASGVIFTRINDNEIGISFSNRSGLPPTPFAITRSEVLNPIGSQQTDVNICFTNRPTTTREIIQNPLTLQRVTAPPVNIQTPENYGNYSFDQYVSLLDDRPPEPGATIQFSPEDIASGERLYNSLRSDNSAERLTVSPEIEATTNRLLGDQNFMNQLAELTTNSSSNAFDPTDFRNLVEENLTETETLTDGLLMYLESTLIPGTFRNLASINPSQRIESINRVTEQVLGTFVDQFLQENTLNTHLYHNAEGELIPFTDQEKATIRNVLVTQNLLSETATESQIHAQIANLENLSNATDQLSQGTVLLTTAGIRHIANSQGFREMILNPNSTIQVLGTPQTLNHDNPDHQITSAFIRNIVEPPFPPEPVESLEGEQLQSLFNSETIVKLLSMNFDYEGNTVPVMLALYGRTGTDILANIQDNLNNPTALKQYIETLGETELTLLNHFIDFATEIRSKTTNGTQINLVRYPDGTNLGSMEVNINSGTIYLANCGNITMFYNFGFVSTITNEYSTSGDIIGLAALNMQNGLSTSVTARTMGIGLGVSITPDDDDGVKDRRNTPVRRNTEDGAEDDEAAAAL